MSNVGHIPGCYEVRPASHARAYLKARHVVFATS